MAFLEKCLWCARDCLHCNYYCKTEKRCNKFPDSEKFKSLVEYNQGCRNWICYKDIKKE